MVLGMIITFTSFVISYYTCALIIKCAKNDTDYVFTLKKYYGKTGFYLGIIGPVILIFGALTAYFIIIVQSFYPLVYVFLKEVCGIKSLRYINRSEEPTFKIDHFTTFSPSYVSIFLFVVLVSISMKKDLTIFMKMGSIGGTCLTIMITFTVSYGIYSLTNTNYRTVLDPAEANSSDALDPVKDMHFLFMFNSKYSGLAGLLCTGYFIH